MFRSVLRPSSGTSAQEHIQEDSVEVYLLCSFNQQNAHVVN